MLTDTWTPERTTALYAMVTEQKLSAGQIAAAMGLSRNSVISKIFRSGLRLAGATKSGPKGPRVKREDKLSHVPAGPRLVPHTKPTSAAIEPLRVPFMKLKAHSCRYPLEDRGPDGLRLFCGRRTSRSNCPWCHEHEIRMFHCE